VLAFDGLDTFATVKLNGTVILESDNMFIPKRVDVTKHVTASQDHVLEIDFDSALLRARELQKQHPDHKWVCFNGEPARLAVRKAQYHWGWDWGPVLMTCGPWRPVRLEVYELRLVDLSVDYTIDPGWHGVRGTIFAQTEGVEDGAEVAFRVTLKGGSEVCNARVPVNGRGLAKVEFSVKDAQLWYPHGYGSQALYDFEAQLVVDKLTVDKKTKRIGLRQVDLVQEPDTVGKTFYFRINGIDVYCGGSDWIPADSFVPRISDEKYRWWLQMMVDGNQVMVR
jgi:beta-mannosidase